MKEMQVESNILLAPTCMLVPITCKVCFQIPEFGDLKKTRPQGNPQINNPVVPLVVVV